MNYFEAKNIHKSFDNHKVIEDISITLKEAECVSLLGISGIGKTTLFNVLAGLYKPDQGQVILKNEDITNSTGKISYMQQDDLLLEFKNIVDNVSLPLILKGIKKPQAIDEAQKYFPQFGLEGTENKYPSQLSGGMRQRAALLRTYLFSNNLMLLDEPFSALDAITKLNIHSWFLKTIKLFKSTIIFITHDIDEAIYLSDRIYILSGTPGKITKEIIVSAKNRDSNFSLTEDFLSIKKDIIESLNLY